MKALKNLHDHLYLHQRPVLSGHSNDFDDTGMSTANPISCPTEEPLVCHDKWNYSEFFTRLLLLKIASPIWDIRRSDICIHIHNYEFSNSHKLMKVFHCFDYCQSFTLNIGIFSSTLFNYPNTQHSSVADNVREHDQFITTKHHKTHRP